MCHVCCELFVLSVQSGAALKVQDDMFIIDCYHHNCNSRTLSNTRHLPQQPIHSLLSLPAGKPGPLSGDAPKYPSGQTKNTNNRQPYQYISTGFSTVQIAVQCAMFTVTDVGFGSCTQRPQPVIPSNIFPYPTYSFIQRANAPLTESAHVHVTTHLFIVIAIVFVSTQFRISRSLSVI